MIRTLHVILTAAALSALVACDAGDKETAGPSASAAAQDLHALFADAWQARLDANPLAATSVGDHSKNDQLPSVSFADLEANAEASRQFLERLEAIDRDALLESDRVNARMFERQMSYNVRSFELGGWQLPWNADSGFHMGFARLPRSMPFGNVKDYENYIARLEKMPQYFDQQMANLRAGLEAGFSQPRQSMLGYEETIRPVIQENPESSVFFAPFESFPSSVDAAAQDRLKDSGRKVIRDHVNPAFESLATFFLDEYFKETRESFGASEMPGGREYYESEVRWYTTLDLSPEEIHEIGLAEVARIRSEMDAIIDRVAFQGTFAEFLEFLRTDPRFYPKTEQELLERAAWISKKMDGKLPELFGFLPRLPYTVEPVPPHIAPKYTAGRYVGPSYGTTEPGIYWVNTSKLNTRTLYTLEALSLHEAVPGHHFQNSIALELENVPAFRRFDYISAFGEGWGLYSERLGKEVGFYEDPYSDFGRLTYEMWRACRLVVDTGVHAKGWTRQQMLDYLAENTALSRHEIQTETDRYITWPGQALSYKLGEIKIRELRKRAEERLGSAFDVRRFHDEVLRHGSVPLDVLEELIESYLAQASSGSG